MPVGKPLHLRLFLEGEEVPVISAQVQINTSAPATASVQIIPLDSALDFLPRTMVHLFFLDTKVDTTFGPKQEGKASLQGEYRLLFSGEVVGFAYSQTPASRGIVLQCIDFSNYWDSANVMAVSYGPGGNAFTNQGAVNGAQLGMFTDIPGDSAAEHLTRWLNERPVTKGLTGISGLAGGVIHIMEAMGGVPGHFKGVNDFYTIAELRCRLLNQITAEENDTTASRVLNQNVFQEWLKNGIEQVGGNVTFRDIMKLLFQYIYYEFVPNPAPKFDDATKNRIKATGDTTLSADPKIAGIKTALEDVRNKVHSRTLALFDSPVSQKTFLGWAQSFLEDLKPIKKKLDAYDKKSKEAKKASGFVSQANSAFSKLLLTDTLSRDAFQAADKALRDAVDILASGTIQGSAEDVVFSSQRLRTQIVRPDCWFTAPPACNVIFPEMYAQITYDRNYLQETTRLLISTFDTLVGRDSLLANHILAPLNGYNDAAKQAKYKGAKSFRILMDHEIHVGIIAKSEWLPNTAGVGQSLDAAQMKKVSNGRLDWVTKASLFNFFKYRFAARQVSVAGRFNPFLVCGFPGAVITKPYTISGGADGLRAGHSGQPVPDSEINAVIHEKADLFNAPSHFVGMIGGIQHSIDQSGGTTSATLHHVRKHRGIDDEFINLLRTTNEGTAKKIVKVRIELEAAEKLATQKNPNTKPLAILLGVTPQTEETTKTPKAGDKPPNLKTKNSETKAKKVLPTAADIGAALKEGTSSLDLRSKSQKDTDEKFESTFGSTQVSEQDASSAQSSVVKDKPRTKSGGKIPEVNRTDVVVPHGSTKIKVNDKKGLYGGRIVGIEVNDAAFRKVSFDVFSKVAKYKETGIAGHQLVADGTTTKKTNNKGVAFKVVTIYEEVSFPSSGVLPLEEILRPSWFSTAYSNQNIGKKIYQPFFGCDSVVDGLTVSGTPPASADASPDADPVDAATSVGDLKTRLESEEASVKANSVEKALNILGYQYGQVKSNGMDVDSFIRDYTDRPIATFRDIFGDRFEPGGLEFTITDSAVGGDAKVKQVSDGKGGKKDPRIGFHTGATHPDLVGTLEKGGKLVGLVSDLQLGTSRAGKIGKDEPLVQSYDVRPAKKARVKAYLEDLTRGPGFRGG